MVVPDEGSHVTLESLIEHCAAQGLPRQKFPEQLAIVEALVRNPMGKVIKPQLRAQVLASQGLTNGRCAGGAQKD